MPETKYDAAILQQYADDLYAQARSVIATTAFIYGLVAFGVAFLLSNSATFFRSNADFTILPAAVVGLIGAAVGVAAGRRKAFKLKLEAQTLLCQRQVELNTRAAAKPESMSAVAGR
jgi:hypothetical protein